MNTTTNRCRDGWSGLIGTGAWVILVLAIGGAWSTGYIPSWLDGSAHEFGEGNHETAGPVSVYWENRYSERRDPSISVTRATAFSTDGSLVYVTGSSAGVSRFHHPVTVAYDAGTGAVVWTAAHTEFGTKGGRATAMAVCPHSGNVFIAGRRNRASGASFFILAYDGTSGGLLWEGEPSRSGSAAGATSDIEISPCGSRVHVLARSRSDAALLSTFDARTGSRLWVERLALNGRFLNGFVAASPDGRSVFSVMSAAVEGASGRWSAFAVDAETGAVQWVGSGNLKEGEKVRGFDVCPSGSSLFFTASAPGPGADSSSGWTLRALGAEDGGQLWEKRGAISGASGLIVVSGMAVSVCGERLFLIGTRFEGREGRGIVVVARAAESGDRLWERDLAEKDALAVEARAIAIAPDGGAIAVTAERKMGPLPFVTVGIDSESGDRRWLVESGAAGVGRAGPATVAFSPDSRFVVASGRSRLADRYSADFITYLYDTGAGRGMVSP